MSVVFDLEIPNAREGLFVPHGFATAEQVVDVIVEAEKLGFNAVWATDFFAPVESSGISLKSPPTWFEPLMILANAAANTKKIKLGTGVLMLPYRDPTVLAKQVSTLDHLSSGRLLLGIGLGAYRDEFARVRAHQAKAHRGRILDEYLEILIRLLSDERNVSMDGRYVSLDRIDMHPKPIQPPLPIYLPARGAHSYERIANWDLNVMVPALNGSKFLGELSPFLASAGKELASRDIIGEAELHMGATNEAAARSYQNTAMGQFRIERAIPQNRKSLETMVSANWIGNAESIIDKMNLSKEQGIRHFNLLHVAADSLSSRLEQMQQFAEEVMPHVR